MGRNASRERGEVAAAPAGAPQLATLPFQEAQPLMQPYQYHPVQAHSRGASDGLPPLRPVFGCTLEQLFERDQSPVPMIVHQCIQAVDLFGLEMEGIYRISGSSAHIQKMKAVFDSGMWLFLGRVLS